MNIKKEYLKYVLFQRTGYLKNNVVSRALTIFGKIQLFHKTSIYLKAFMFSARINKEYKEDMYSEYLLIKPYLPSNIEAILDIGCGIAGINVFIYNHYKNNINIYLIDKTSTHELIHYDFNKTGAFYNSLAAAKQVLINNSVNADHIHLQEVTEDNSISFVVKFDIVISFISWGFHYPMSTYLEATYQKLKVNGVLIIDIRKNTGGENEILQKFGNFKIIHTTSSYDRVLAIKQSITTP